MRTTQRHAVSGMLYLLNGKTTDTRNQGRLMTQPTRHWPGKCEDLNSDSQSLIEKAGCVA